MSGRPRIRTIKPEFWQDESVGELSRDARLLLIGLITMADDEGRLRLLTASVLGHAYPYDDDAARRLPAWLGEIERSGIVLFYESDGKRYAAFRHWRRHQRVNRARPSVLPAPPDQDVVTENSVQPHAPVSDVSVNHHGEISDDAHLPRVPIPSLPVVDERSGPSRRRAREAPPDKLPDDLAEPLAAIAPFVVETLRRVQEAKRAKPVTLAAVGRALATFPDHDHRRIVGEFEHWWVHGHGASRPVRDVVLTYRNRLHDLPSAGAPVVVPIRPAEKSMHQRLLEAERRRQTDATDGAA